MPLCLALVLPIAAHAFGFEDVAKRARELSGAKFKAPESNLPTELRELGYDAYRDIRYRPEKALWRAEKLPFELMFFHPGRNFQDSVRINTVDANAVHRVEFDPDAFDYGRNKFDPKKLRNLGYAGFRVHYAINRPNYKDEVLVFLGASYFRAVGKGQVYGMSARGLAIDTAAAPGEDFARFTEFWVERPRANATSLVIYALLDSQRMTGAYRFLLTPGVDTVTQVTARVYARDTVSKLGIAPLNSMYYFGENQPGPSDDYRPEVHDSDGLSIANGDGNWYWRPLTDPKRLLVTSFGATNPKGYGLMQRDRSSASYEDPETLYERRPSGWVEPDRQLGGRAGRTGADPDAGRDQRQHRRLLGLRHALHRQEAAQLRLQAALADARPDAARSRLGPADPARPRLRQDPGGRDQLHRRFRRADPARAQERCQARARGRHRQQCRTARTHPVPEPGDRCLAPDPACQARRRRQAGRDAGPDKVRQSAADRNLELHRAARIGEAVTAEATSSDDRPGPASAAEVPMPAIHRSSMALHPWAGHPLWRPVRRLLKGRAPRPWAEEGGDVERPLLMRRVLLLTLVLFGAFTGTDYMIDIMPNHGHDWAERGLLVLFAILFAWVSAGFWTAVLGAWVMLRRHDPNAVTAVLHGAAGTAPIADDARTAVIMPICNEDVGTVFAGLRATYESLQLTDAARHFDFYILSDTNDPDARAAEQVAWADLASALRSADPAGREARIYYRWRQHRTHRKAGNVSDFCRRFGADYRYMIVLDADSVMSGDCLVSMVRMMEAHPDTGIIQTAPRAAGHETTHARILQFCSRVYGPLFTAGLHYWQLGESHYWGHNAILRLAPFIRHCALPALPGSTSLSGGVMSHDFVEAALMRRAGWKVWIAYDLDGSYEQVPPNLLAELGRDRRWAQGNLQNSRLTFEPGLHPVHRTVFVTGVLAYISSPLWLAFLVLSTVLFATHSNLVPTYFVEPYQLFPIWPTANFKLMLTLFGLTAVLLFAPKVISLIAIILKGEARRYGGAGKLLFSALLETLHSVLLAPVRMLFHTQFVLAALTGIKLEWKSPPRDDAATGWGEAFRRHLLGSVLALTWIGVILVSSATFQWWLSPVLAGLLLAIPLSAWTSHAAPGRWLARRGIFVIPEELAQPPVLAQADRYAEAFADMPGFVQVVNDRAALDRAVRALPARPDASGAKASAQQALVDRAASAGPAALSKADRLRLLADAQALRALHDRVAGRDANRDWWAGASASVPSVVSNAVTSDAVASAH